MKKLLTLLFIATLAFSAVACNAVANESNNDVTSELPTNDVSIINDDADCQLAETVPFETLNLNNLPESLQGLVDMNRLESGHEVVKNDEGTYLIVYMGQKSSGGFDIKVIDIFVTPDGYSATVEEIAPGEDDMVTMALTYPVAVVKIDSDLITGENIIINRFDNTGGLTPVDPEETPDFYTTSLEPYEEGQTIIIGELMQIEGNLIHIISGDIVQVFKADEDTLKNFFIGETVELIKSGKGFEMNSYLREDFDLNFTSMGNPLISVEGTVTEVMGNDFTFETAQGEVLQVSGADFLMISKGESLTLEYVAFHTNENFATQVLRPQELYELKVLEINRLDSGLMQLSATTDLDSEEVSYIVTLDMSTTLRLNLSEIQVGDVVKAYAEYVLESYPMQMSPKFITR